MSSNNNGGGVSIPSSTVVSIGGGFVALALIVLSSLLLYRVCRIALEARRRRRSGEQVMFHDLWSREGGVWGFLTGLGGNEGGLIGPGAGMGARSEMFISRMRAEIRMWEQLKEQTEAAKPIPKLWEVGLEEKGRMVGAKELHVEDCLPLGVLASNPPENIELNDNDSELDLLDPRLNLSVLIVYPSRPYDESRKRRIASDEEDWSELPEMVLGSTPLTPYIRPQPFLVDQMRNTTSSDGKCTDEQHEGNLGPGVEKEKEAFDERYETYGEHSLPVLGHTDASQSWRRAGWKRIGGNWVIEGINDDEEG